MRRHHRSRRVIGGGGAATGGVFFGFAVDAAGDGDETTINAAIGTAGIKYIWVKNGVYDEDLVCNAPNQYIYFEPGTEVDANVSAGTITVSADNVTLEFGSGCILDGDIDWTGANGKFIARNAVSCQGIDVGDVTATGTFFSLDGGGWETIFSGEVVNNNPFNMYDCFAMDQITGTIRFDTALTGNRFILSSYKVSGNILSVRDQSTDGGSLISNGTFIASILNALAVSAPNARVLGNHSRGSGADIIVAPGAGDNSIINANLLHNHASGNAIEILSPSEDMVVVGNRVSDRGVGAGINDLSGTSTVGANDETGF